MRFIAKPIAWALIACLACNPVYGFYLMTGLVFFTPFPAFADNFIDKATEGQTFGKQIRSDFSLPGVNSTTGEMTLNNGLAAGQTLQQNELFQQIQPGSMDGIAASYGDSAAMGAQVNSNLSNLATGTSIHADAYQTLMGANTSMPDMYNDPIWKTSDDIYSLKSPLINDLFNGCEKKTNFSEKSCPKHIEDLKTCKKAAKTEMCKVTRQIALSTQKTVELVSVDGTGGVASVGFVEAPPTGLKLTLGAGTGFGLPNQGPCNPRIDAMTINVNDASLLTSAVIARALANDNIKLTIDNVPVFDSGGCVDVAPWDSPFNLDVLGYFTNGPHTIKLYTYASDLANYGGYIEINLTMKPALEETFIDYPAGCRQRLADNWPPTGTVGTFIPSGSLEDQASTDWWQCTDAANSRTFSGVALTPASPVIALQPILPDPPASPPAPICYAAQTRVPGHVALACFTDKDGYQVCPQFDYNTDEHSGCDQFASNPQCAYITETCADGATNPVTGTCQEFIVTYDCGADQPMQCGQVNDGEKTICDGAIRCMGGECIDPATESNQDFIRAATALQVLNQAQQSNGCDPSTGDCALFGGEPMECQMADLSILGSVDCCNMPIQGSWIDYMKFAASSWELADTSVEMYTLSQYGQNAVDAFGAWDLVTHNTVLSTPFGTVKDAWNAVTEPFTSTYDSVVSMVGGDTGVGLGLDALKQKAMQWMSNWVIDKFGAAAGEALFSYSTPPITNAAGSVLQEGTVTGMGSMLAEIINVVGIIYAIYNIAKMVVQLIFACTKDELKLNMLKSQKLCTAPTTIGTYCSADMLGICVARKEAYCCFSSPFSRIFQEQARPQLGMTFGDPKAPTCEGLPISKIAELDFNKMDFSEWIGMLKISEQLPVDSLTADAMYDKANITKGKLPNAAKENAQDRLDIQTQGSDIDAIRQHLLDNL